MTFLNPLVLLGLAAAALPVLLHLLNLRKLRTIEFSTLSFLQELQQTKIRRLKLRQILLLIIRTLLIIFIILAFARPALRGSILGSIGSNARSTVVFIIDDSFSETGSDEHGERLKQVKDASLRLIDLMKNGDEGYLIRLSDLPKVTVDPAVHDPDILRTAVKEMTVSPVRRPMDEAVRTSARLLAASANANKEVYIVSDMQKSLFGRTPGGFPDPPASLFDERVQLFTIPIGTKLISNVSVDSVEVLSKILEKERPVKITAGIRNFTQSPLRNYVVSAYVDGARAAQSSVSVDPFGSAFVELTVTPKRAGDLAGYVELEHDAIEQDDRRYFALHIPDHLNVSMVGGTSADLDYIALALASGANSGSPSTLRVDRMTEEKLPSLDLRNTDVLILSNVRSYSSSDADRIKTFVERGGGLLFFPGDRIDLQGTNRMLLSPLQIPPIESASTGGGHSTFRQVDLDHPLFESMFQKTPVGKTANVAETESPTVTMSVRHAAGKRARSLITLSDGTPFLTEQSAGQGRILFYSVAPVLKWSDFPVKGIFAPLIYRSVIFAAGGTDPVHETVSGAAPEVTVTAPMRLTAANPWRLVSPDGTEDILQPTESAKAKEFFAGTSFSLKQLQTPGVYSITAEQQSVSSLVVNVDRLESDTRIAGSSDLDAFWGRLHVPTANVKQIGTGDDIAPAILQSRYGVELWKYCIIIALLLALAEMLIARDSQKSLQQTPA